MIDEIRRNEKTLAQQYLNELEPHFHIAREVQGRHFSGKRLRVDAVLRPKVTAEWKCQDVAFAIEFKDTERFRQQSFDTKDYTKWLAQCVDYANTEWENFGYLYVFSCPSLIDGANIADEMFVRNFMGQLGIGEIKNLKNYGLSILLHGHHRIWSASQGVEFGKHYTLKKQFGSR